MITIQYNVTEVRLLLNKGRLGTVPGGGRTVEGREIATLTFLRNAIVEYVMADGNRGPKFQDVMFLDD